MSYRFPEVRIVAAVFRIGTEIMIGFPALFQMLQDCLFQSKSAVITANCNSTTI